MKSLVAGLLFSFFSISAQAYIDGSKCLKSEVYFRALKVFPSGHCYTGLSADVNGNILCVSRDSIGFKDLQRGAGRIRFEVCARFDSIGYLLVTEVMSPKFY